MSPVISKNGSIKVLALSIPLMVLITGVSIVAIFSDNFYQAETQTWKIQAVGQDIIDLVLIVPVLMVTTLMTLKFRSIGFPIWGGVILYLIYTFIIYSFDVHFNNLFVFYCITLGLSFYSFLYFSYSQFKEPYSPNVEGTLLRRVIGIYFIIIATLFYVLWLSETLPAILSNTSPKALTDAGLPTNPVHALDLAIALPGIFMTGILLMRNKKTGHVFTPVFLMFFILMNITIGSLSIMMQQKGLESNLTLPIVMSALAIFSFALLILYMKKLS